jgi:4-amino-4-deoxychorismate lyase
MSRLIETIRVAEGKIENMEYHLKRMRASIGSFDWDLNINVPANGLHKLRIVYDASRFEYTITPYTIKPIRSLKLVANDKIMYDHKYEERSALQEIFNQRKDCDDVLIVKNNVVTDASYANIIFKKGNDWITPDSFLLNGTMRQYLLDRNQVSEARITPADLAKYSHFKLINAMLRMDAPESEIVNIR